MSEKAEKKPEAAPAPAKEGAEKKEEGKKAGGGGLLAKTPVLLGIVMIIEAVVLFAGFKFLGGGPKQAAAIDLVKEEGDHGGGGHGEHGDKEGAKKGPTEKEMPVEVLPTFKESNAQSGRRYIYEMSVSAVVKSENEEKVKEIIKNRQVFIRDRIGTIIRQIDPDKLAGGSEPGLETLKRQIKAQLEIIVGDGMIEEVLVPACIPYRADF